MDENRENGGKVRVEAFQNLNEQSNPKDKVMETASLLCKKPELLDSGCSSECSETTGI